MSSFEGTPGASETPASTLEASGPSEENAVPAATGRRPRRKLLVASLGVATMTYMGMNCSSDGPVANLVAPPIDGSSDGDARDATADGRGDAADADTAGDGARDMSFVDLPVANLVAPPLAKLK